MSQDLRGPHGGPGAAPYGGAPSDPMARAATPLERVAAELTAAMAADAAGADDVLPPSLAARIAADGVRVVSGMADGVAPSVPEAGDSVGRDVVRMRPSAPRATDRMVPARAPDVVRWSGWIAAAAVLLAWVVVPSMRPSAWRSGSEGTVASTPARDTRGAVPDAGRLLREALLAANPSALVLPWQATSDVAAVGASGDMLWSAEAQRGVMRIAGLAANDPSRLQYQLWIFDAARDERYPVDGGVFDVPAGVGEVLVPVQPRIPVGEATLFAITVERPGGTVVSDRERIVLLAQRDD